MKNIVVTALSLTALIFAFPAFAGNENVQTNVQIRTSSGHGNSNYQRNRQKINDHYYNRYNDDYYNRSYQNGVYINWQGNNPYYDRSCDCNCNNSRNYGYKNDRQYQNRSTTSIIFIYR